MWKDGDGLPYDGWYGGRVEMMIKNGTYADFRPKIVRRVEKGFYSIKGTTVERVEDSRAKLAKWDKEWEAMPVEERIALRNRVADDVEIKEKVVHTARGPMKVFRSRPSCNNNLDKRKNEVSKKTRQKLPSGAIVRETNPIAGNRTDGVAASSAADVGIKTPMNQKSLEPASV